MLFADAVGSSRLMRAAEARAIRSVRWHLGLMHDLVKEMGGVVHGGAGDSVFASFDSALDAVVCACAIQDRPVPPDDLFDIPFRIGLHLGDIVEISGDQHGDSINTAARLEPLAPPGGICVSRSMFDALRGNSEFRFTPMGRPSLKNLGDDLEVFQVELIGALPERVSPSAARPTLAEPAAPTFAPPATSDATPASIPIPAAQAAAPSLLAPAANGEAFDFGANAFRPIIAVLPFQSVSERADMAALAECFADELIGFLTRFRSLDVIARGSTVHGDLANMRPRELRQKLGAKYVVQGRSRLLASRIRVKVQLVQTESERVVWTEDYDRSFDDIFDVQEEIAQQAVSTMAVQIEEFERRLVRERRPDSLDAYALQLQAREASFWTVKESGARARELAEQAIELSPDYARAHAVLSRTLSLGWKYGWSDNPDASFVAAHDAAMRAVDYDRNDARGLAELGFVTLYRREHDRSLAAFARALELNPSDADIIAEYADSLKHAGEKAKAIELFERAIRLNPYHRDGYARDLAHTYFVDRQFEKAIQTINGMVNPNMALRVLTASYSHLGRDTEAADAAKRLRAQHPDFSARAWAHIVPDRDSDDTELLVEGLVNAGL